DVQRAHRRLVRAGPGQRRARRQTGRRGGGRVPDVLRRGHPPAPAGHAGRRARRSALRLRQRRQRRRRARLTLGTDAMQCVILAGGLGTRMWPEAQTVPKTLLPVHDRPFASWQLDWLSSAGIDSIVYCIGYHGGLVRDFVADGSAWGLSRVAYVDEGADLRGTAGAL